jgi:RimJ/RimL family protein N-acetyltransferase
MRKVEIRMLEPDEWELFRDFRLAALQSTPGVYGTRYADAVTRTEEAWRKTIRGPSNQSFGLFAGEKLIGITSVFEWDEDPSGRTAILASSFILDAYRGKGLATMLYEARLAWIRSQTQYARVVVGHRLSNEPSRRATVAHGFTLFRRQSADWPDGTTEDELFYEMDLGRGVR